MHTQLGQKSFNAVLRYGYRLVWLGIALALATGLSCSTSQGGDTQTNWLKSCSGDAECGKLSCLCGHCVKPCASAADCSEAPRAATCQPSASTAVQTLCAADPSSAEDAGTSGMCLTTCTDQNPCPATERCVAGACLPASASSPDGGAPPLVSADFCPRLYEALCSHMERCGCDAAAAARCRTFAAEGCPDPSNIWVAYDQAVSAGGLVYHPEAIAAALAPLASADAPCQKPFIDLGMDSVTASTFGGVLIGTREFGSPCSLPVSFKGGAHDCKAGLICGGEGATTARCNALVGAGAECDTGADSTRHCFEQRPPDTDNEFATAFDTLTCVPSSPGSATGTCSSNLDDGLPCASNESCKSGRCLRDTTSLCAPKLADGQLCMSSRDCTSGACANSTGAVCSAPLADGQACGYDDQNCQSGKCLAPDNQTSGQSSGLCGPKLDRAVGEACSQGYECATGTCRSNLCTARICTAF